MERRGGERRKGGNGREVDEEREERGGRRGRRGGEKGRNPGKNGQLVDKEKGSAKDWHKRRVTRASAAT